MIVDKVKEVQLVEESRVVKLSAGDNTLQRYDKTIYAVEPSPINIEGQGEAYIEAQKFFTLLPEASKVEICTNYVLLILKNGAEYKLPFMTGSRDKEIKWATNTLPAKFDQNKSISIKMASGRLTSATLKNLANPMLQCIYVDNISGVSCNSMVACLDGTVVSPTPLLLPPDIVSLMEGRESNLAVIGNNYVVKIADAFVVCPIPEYSYAESAATLRNSLPPNITKYPVNGLLEEVKRLSSFGDYLSFDGTRVVVGENFEPFSLPSAVPEYSYAVQYLLTVLPQVTHIAQSEFALLLFGDKFLFMISPETKE